MIQQNRIIFENLTRSDKKKVRAKIKFIDEMIFLSLVHLKLAFSVSFYVRKVNFPALVRENFKCAENQLYARKATPIRLTFGIRWTKKSSQLTVIINEPFKFYVLYIKKVILHERINV